jgi:hypothetical protein
MTLIAGKTRYLLLGTKVLDDPRIRWSDTLTEENKFGESTIARSFAASVDISMPEQSMYLVIGHYHSPSGLVRAVGGRVALQISGNQLLANLPIKAYFALRRRADTVFVGPITLDQERFAQFMALHRQNLIQNPIG